MTTTSHDLTAMLSATCRGEVEARFWSMADYLGECWGWTSVRQKSGHGRFKLNGKHVGAHRLAYTLAIGEIPPDHEIHHRCRNRACVRPEHLQILTTDEHRAIEPTPAQINAARTSCVNGHAYTPENTRINKEGHRNCRACNAARKRAARHAGGAGVGRGGHKRLNTHCPHGHPFDGINSYHNGKQRVCRACNRAQVKAHRLRHRQPLNTP